MKMAAAGGPRAWGTADSLGQLRSKVFTIRLRSRVDDLFGPGTDITVVPPARILDETPD
jgi:hypothetical protein